MRVGLISCTKRKKSKPCKAYEMYSTSQLFRRAYAYATTSYDQVAILSAKHGLLLPNDWIEPYDLTLKDLNKKQRMMWAERVYKQMREKLGLENLRDVYFHCGISYREFLISRLEKHGIACHVPLHGRRYGEQLAWYDSR